MIEIKGVFDEYEKRIYKLNNGEYILIEIDGDTTSVILIDQPVVDFEELGKIGSFEFDMQEEDYGPQIISRAKVLQMHLGGLDRKYLRKGIGKEIIRLKEEEVGELVVFGKNDGFRSSDGSYLTDDGPGFVEAIYAKR